MSPIITYIITVIILNHETLNYSRCSENILPNTVHIHLKISENLPFFKGHFPNDPILPAVAILDITDHMIREFFHQNQAPPVYTQVLHLKVKHKIVPNTQTRLEIFQKKTELNKNSFEVIWRLLDVPENPVAVDISLVYESL